MVSAPCAFCELKVEFLFQFFNPFAFGSAIKILMFHADAQVAGHR